MFKEKTVDEKLVYDGKIIKVFSLKVELENNTISGREVVRHNGGACVVAVDNDLNICLVKQYRKPIEQVTIEVPAGKLEIGEDPYLCAVRELKEETGITAEKIESLGFIYPTPGFCDEKLYIYIATGLIQGEMNLDVDEFLLYEKFPIKKCIEMIENGEINDSKTVIAILRAARRFDQ